MVCTAYTRGHGVQKDTLNDDNDGANGKFNYVHVHILFLRNFIPIVSVPRRVFLKPPRLQKLCTVRCALQKRKEEARTFDGAVFSWPQQVFFLLLSEVHRAFQKRIFIF